MDVVIDNIKNSDGSDYIVSLGNKIAGEVARRVIGSEDPRYLTVYRHLDDILSKASYLESAIYDWHSGIDKTGDVKRYDYLNSKVQVGDDLFNVQVDVEINNSNNRARTYEIKKLSFRKQRISRSKSDATRFLWTTLL